MRCRGVLAVMLLAIPASAHVVTSVEHNNRYVKLTLGADRVRLAYTVIFGEVPGAQARRLIDRDGDRTISDTEGQAFADTLGREVAAQLELAVDGAAQPIAWSTAAIGLGTPATRAGAFAVDLVATPCLAPGADHRVSLRDRYPLPRPGETELTVEDSPGVRVTRAQVGGRDLGVTGYTFDGAGGPLADHGAELTFTVAANAPRAAGACSAPSRGSATSWLGLAAAGVLALAASTVLVIRRQRSQVRVG